MIKYLKVLIKSNKKYVANNNGMTLVEMLATFALLGLFMVAATRVIAYIMGIYYAAKGNTYGLEVTNMISNKIVGQIENANIYSTYHIVEDDNWNEDKTSKERSAPIVYNRGDLDRIKFIDKDGAVVEYSIDPNTHVLNIHYYETVDYNASEDSGYAATNWYFDSAAYMGYTISKFDISYPGGEYEKDTMKLILEVDSPKYGTYESTYYIKCRNLEKNNNGTEEPYDEDIDNSIVIYR